MSKRGGDVVGLQRARQVVVDRLAISGKAQELASILGQLDGCEVLAFGAEVEFAADRRQRTEVDVKQFFPGDGLAIG